MRAGLYVHYMYCVPAMDDVLNKTVRCSFRYYFYALQSIFLYKQSDIVPVQTLFINSVNDCYNSVKLEGIALV